jgi:2,5-diketo-D-gluconate reductase A
MLPERFCARISPARVRDPQIVKQTDRSRFALTTEEMASLATLDTKASNFFDHRDPKMVKRLGEVRGIS